MGQPFVHVVPELAEDASLCQGVPLSARDPPRSTIRMDVMQLPPFIATHTVRHLVNDTHHALHDYPIG